MPILQGEQQIAAGTKNVVDEEDTIARGNGQKKRIELCGRAQASGISGAQSPSCVEFAAAIECVLQLRPAANDGTACEPRSTTITIVPVIPRPSRRERRPTH